MNEENIEIIVDFLEADCPYFSGRNALTEYNIVTNPTIEMADSYLNEGWRRFGKMFFRPSCTKCSNCIPLRIELEKFYLTKSMRRTLSKNKNIRLEIGDPEPTQHKLDLYNQYHFAQMMKKNWPHRSLSLDDYYIYFCEPMPFAKEYRYFDSSNNLLGVGYVDIQSDAISSVYFFYDMKWAPSSPGVYSILSEIEQARKIGVKYYHLGYYVKNCADMSYKLRFQPHELLKGDSEVWDWHESAWVSTICPPN